jgi:uncharacterized protein with PIN domain
MPRLTLRFYAELNDFLGRELRARSFVHEAPPRAPLRDIIEGLGVPHTEVDLVLVNGASASLEDVPPDDARVSVYPVFEALDISPVLRVRPAPLRDPRFVLDVHLGRLAAYLRVAGFDAWYRNDADDEELATISAGERRILLTRDQGLLKRRIVTHGCWVRETKPARQLAEVIHRFDLAGLVKPFTRCVRCNTPLEPATREAVEARLPDRVRSLYQEFSRCPGCGGVFWKGTHYTRLRDLLDRAMGTERS